MDQPNSPKSWIEPLLLSRIPRLPRFPIAASAIDAMLLYRLPIVLIVVILLALVTFYAPELAAYGQYVDEPGIHTATRPGWTMVNVGIWIMGTVGAWSFAAFGARANRKLVDTLIENFPDKGHSVTANAICHRGIGRVLAIAILITGGLVTVASLTQESSLLWKAPAIHVPLVMVHQSAAYFIASYFMLRVLVMNKLITMCLSGGRLPLLRWTGDGLRLYVLVGRHYIISVAFAVFAVMFLLSFWFGFVAEWGSSDPAVVYLATFAAALVIPLYVGLTIGLLVQPIWFQRKALRMWRQRRLDGLAKEIDRLLTVWSLESKPTVLERLSQLKTAHDVLSASLPERPLSPRQRRIVVGVATGLLLPLILTVFRAVFA